MRILFTFAGGRGHLEPLLPIARAAELAGHTVAFAGRPWMIPWVQACGFPAFATGSDVGLRPKRLPLAAVDVERDMRAVGAGFDRRVARERAADVYRRCIEWKPDPPGITRPDIAPTIYVTLGTIYNMESGDLFQRVIAGLRDLSMNLLVTVGHDIDPDEFGPQPGNVHIERYVPQAELLPHCHGVVSHGGSGSVMGALAHGLPLVVIPMGADQPLNAARCEALGLARVIAAATATPQGVREAVSQVLEDSSYRRAAERIRDEIAALPGPEHAITLLERLASQERSRFSR